jgi:hypothetical protein
MSTPPPNKTTNSGRIGLTVLGLVLIIAGGVFTKVLWVAYQRVVEVRDTWAPASTIINISEFEEVKDDMNATPVYEVKIKYSYTVDLQNYDSYRVTRADANKEAKITRTVKDKSVAEALVAKYPLGQPVRCYINPLDTKQAVLEFGHMGSLYSIWFPLLFVVGGLGMIINIWLPHASDKVKIPPSAEPKAE